MRESYNICLDLVDNELKELVLEYIFELSFIDKLCVLEKSDNTLCQPHFLPFNMIVFDHQFENRKELEEYCLYLKRVSPKAIFVHVAERPEKDNKLQLVGVSKSLFSENFAHVVGLCFLTHLVNISLNQVKITHPPSHYDRK
jgi:hypothetical protein